MSTVLTTAKVLTDVYDSVNKALRVSSGLLPSVYDTVTLTQTSTTDVYLFYSAAVLVQTLTLTYTDATKGTLSSVVKT